MSLTRKIIARLIRNHDRTGDVKVRNAYAALEAWASIIVNSTLFALKLAIGLTAGSIALIADSIHTLSDCVTSVVILIGFRLARAPSDEEHPFGHGRWESVTSLIVAVLLFATCVDLFEKSINSIVRPTLPKAATWAIIVVAASALLKEFLARFSMEMGRMIGSSALVADAIHHRSDVLATGMVVVALVAARFGVARVDGIMGIGVSLVIVFTAIRLLRGAINPLLGQMPDPALVADLEAKARSHPGVLDVHEIVVHQYGQTKLITLHIEVSDKESALKLHDVAEEVEAHLASELAATVVVHVDPVNPDHHYYEFVSQKIKEIVAGDPRIESFHDLRIVGLDPSRYKAVFDVVLAGAYTRAKALDVVRQIKARFAEIFPNMRLAITTESRFADKVRETDKPRAGRS